MLVKWPNAKVVSFLSPQSLYTFTLDQSAYWDRKSLVPVLSWNIMIQSYGVRTRPCQISAVCINELESWKFWPSTLNTGNFSCFMIGLNWIHTVKTWLKKYRRSKFQFFQFTVVLCWYVTWHRLYCSDIYCESRATRPNTHTQCTSVRISK